MQWTKRNEWDYSFSQGYLGLDDEPWVEEARYESLSPTYPFPSVLCLVGSLPEAEDEEARWDVDVTDANGFTLNYVVTGLAECRDQAKDLCDAIVEALKRYQTIRES